MLTTISTSLADGSGLFLTPATSIRFLPAANFNGSPGLLTVRLADSSITAPSNGSTVNASSNGGTTAYSAATVSLSTSITAVNDQPSPITVGAITTVNEDSANSTAVSLWSTPPAYGTGGGSDEGSQTLRYTITAIPSFITLFMSNGSTPVTANTTLSAADFAALQYKTVANANGTATITFDVIDSGFGIDPNVNTLASQSVSFTVDAVNDAPVLTTAGAITTVNEDFTNSTALSLWSTAPAYGTGGGSDEGSQTLSYKITAIPSFISLLKSDGTTAVTANTTITAKVPVNAIADGPVILHATLESFAGVRLTIPVDIKMNVILGVEDTVIYDFVGFIALLGAFGVFRTVRKRQRESEANQ
jgi:hypothetical protein